MISLEGQWREFQVDWYGRALPWSVAYRFHLQGGRLHFAARAAKAPECQQQPCGQFVAGLWQQEVAEFFLAGPGTSYQEFNLSPSGAWWSARFSDYRQLEQECPCPSLRTQAWREANHWQAELSLELEDLIEWDHPRLRACAILRPQDPLYLCSVRPDEGPPDFHLSQLWQPVRL